MLGLMARFVFNIAKGRVAELAERVLANDPANSAFVVVVLKGGETQGNMQDADTLAAVIATAADEVTGAGWDRKTLDQASTLAVVTDDGNDRKNVKIGDQQWTPAAAADDSTGFVVCYDPDTTGGTDANLVPLLHEDFAVATDGNQVTYDEAAEGIFRAA